MMMLGLLTGSMAAVKPEMRVQVLSAVEPCRGMRVKKGDTVYITHQGFLEESDGKLGDTAVVTRRQIDSNCAPGVERCEPLAFTVGARLIIRGMERAVVGVCQGETIEAHIPPHLAYDDPARTIPADSRPVPEVRVRARVRVRVSVRVRVRARARVRRANPSPNPNPNPNPHPNQNSWVVYQITIERIERPGSPGELQLGSLVSWQVTRTVTRALALSPHPPHPPAGQRRPVVITPST